MGEWHDVPGYEGRYLISSNGEVFSRLSNKILKHNVSSSGYHTVELFKGDGTPSKRVLIHRLVASVFIPNPYGYPQVNHKDENKANNTAENLEWCTAKYNMNYGQMGKIRHTFIDYTNPIYKENAIRNSMAMRRPVDQFDKDGNYIASYASIKDAERALGVNFSHIVECCKGKRYKTVLGYIWKYRKVV